MAWEFQDSFSTHPINLMVGKNKNQLGLTKEVGLSGVISGVHWVITRSELNWECFAQNSNYLGHIQVCPANCELAY